MINLQKYYTGNFDGTNKGGIFIEFYDPTHLSSLTGELRILDKNINAAALYQIKGTLEDKKLSLTATTQTNNREDVLFGTLTINGTVDDKKSYIFGTWKSELDTGGTFEVFENKRLPEVSQSILGLSYHKVSRPIDSITFFREDYDELMELINKNFEPTKVVISYVEEKESEKNIFQNSFEQYLESNKIENLKLLRIRGSNTENNGLQKTIVIELSKFGNNYFDIQDFENDWVISRKIDLELFFKKRKNKIFSFLKKRLLITNQLLLLFLLISTPDLELKSRIITVLFVVTTIVVVYYAHQKIPQSKIFLANEKPSFFQKHGQEISSAITIIGGLIGIITTITANLTNFF